MRKLVSIFALVIIPILLISGVAYAYTYKANYTVSENTSTAYDMLPVIGYSNNDWMVANGFMSNTTLDTRIETLGGLVKPHMVADNMTLAAIPVPADSQTNLFFTTWNSLLSALKIIVGYGGYYTIPDAAALEMSDNFTDEQKGWVNTDNGTSKNLIYKEHAFRTFVSETVSGNITSIIINERDSLDIGEDTQTGGGGANWEAQTITPTVNYTVTSIEIKVFRLGTPGTCEVSIWDTAVGLPTAGNLATGSFDGDSITAVSPGEWVDITMGSPYTLTAGTTYAIVVRAIGGTPAVDEVEWRGDQTAPPYAGGSRCDSVNSGVAWAAVGGQDFYFKVYGYNSKATATGVSSGEHTVLTEANGTFFGIGIDQTPSDGWPASTDMVLNNPLYHTALSGGTFNSVDTGEYSQTVTGTTWSSVSGRIFAGGADVVTGQAGVAAHSFPGNASFSIEVWVKPLLADASGGILTKGAAGKYEWYFAQDNAGTGAIQLRLFSQTAASRIGRKWTNVGPGYNDVWMHIVGTVDNSGLSSGIKIYNNGIRVDNADDEDLVPPYPGMTNNGEPARVGKVWDAGASFTGSIGEVRIYNDELTLAQVLANYNATKWKYDGSDNFPNYTTVGSGVPGNANDIIENTNNVFPYMDYSKKWVDGTLVAHYQPVTMIIGGILPDEESTNDATITWGSNPVGVNVALGSMSSSGQPAIGETADTPSRDLLPAVEVSDWYVDPNLATLATNPFRPFVTIMSDTTTLTELQAWRFLGLVIVLLVCGAAIKFVPKHLMIACIAGGVATAANVVMTVWPMYALVLLALFVLGGIVSERSRSL